MLSSDMIDTERLKLVECRILNNFGDKWKIALSSVRCSWQNRGPHSALVCQLAIVSARLGACNLRLKLFSLNGPKKLIQNYAIVTLFVPVQTGHWKEVLAPFLFDHLKSSQVSCVEGDILEIRCLRLIDHYTGKLQCTLFFPTSSRYSTQLSHIHRFCMWRNHSENAHLERRMWKTSSCFPGILVFATNNLMTIRNGSFVRLQWK